MKSSFTFYIAFILVICSCMNRTSNLNHSKLNSFPLFSDLDGSYQTGDGIVFNVKAKDSILIISTDSINLYKYSDSWADERVKKCNKKSIELIVATISNDREEIKRIFGEAPMNMDDYIDNYLNMHKEVLLATPKPVKFQVENTFYVDEISNHGHEPNGWRWTTYTRVFWEDGSSQIIRYNWQPETLYIDEWGLDKPVPFKNRMMFHPRKPFRSRINVYNPKTKVTTLLREIDKEDREQTIPARFVSYNIEINQTVSVRFRMLEGGIQYLEIGALEDGLLVKAIRDTTSYKSPN